MKYLFVLVISCFAAHAGAIDTSPFKKLTALNVIASEISESDSRLEIGLDSKGLCNDGAESLLSVLKKVRFGEIPGIKFYFIKVLNWHESNEMQLTDSSVFIALRCHSSPQEILDFLKGSIGELMSLPNDEWANIFQGTFERIDNKAKPLVIVGPLQ